MSPNQDTYSPTHEAKRIFERICGQSPRLGVPDEAIRHSQHVVFETAYDQIYYPIPFKVTETLSALKAMEGCIAAAVADLRFGDTGAQRVVKVDLERATVSGFAAFVSKVDGLTKGDAGLAAKLKDTDIYRAQSDPYRRMAANLYKTKTEGQFFHLHGSLDPTATLKMIGLPSQLPGLNNREEIVGTIGRRVQQYTPEELEELNHRCRAAGVTAYKYEEFVKTRHGAASLRQPWWTVRSHGKKLPPTPFPRTTSKRILQGVKVLELCRVIAGPAVGRSLAEYGADVLKITSSHLPDVPFFQIDGNMGKHTADLDLRTEDGRRQFEALLADVDVVIDGYRPGALDRLGYGFKSLTKLAESRGKGIVYVSENCFGPAGEWYGRPGWQQVADCATGFAWFQGEFMQKREPVVSPLPIADYGAGCMGTIAALSGLYYRATRGGNYHCTATLIQFNLLLFSGGRYSPAVIDCLRDKQPAEFFQLRYCDGVERSSHVVLHSLREQYPQLFVTGGEGRERAVTETWHSMAFSSPIEVAKGAVEVEGIVNGFVRASRPNGTDRASWKDFSPYEGDYRT